jgi:Tfp pilus assembly protein PilO
MEALQQELETQWARAADFDVQIPPTDELSSFMQELARRLDAHGLHPDSIRPGKPVASDQIVALPIAFTVQGPFPALYDMMYEIESMTRLTQVEHFMTEVDDGPTGSATASIRLRVFFQTS